MVEEGASERFDEILIEGQDSMKRKDLLKYIKSNFKLKSYKKINFRAVECDKQRFEK